MYTDIKKEKQNPAPPSSTKKPGSPDEQNASRDWQSTPSTKPADEKYAGQKDIESRPGDTAETSQSAQPDTQKNVGSPDDEKTSTERPSYNAPGSSSTKNVNERYSSQKDMAAEQKK